MRHALCQVLKHGDEPSDCESSCPCYYSQIEGLGLHVVNITRYVIRIKKHLHNRIEIIEIESNRKEYESLHPYKGGICGMIWADFETQVHVGTSLKTKKDKQIDLTSVYK